MKFPNKSVKKQNLLSRQIRVLYKLVDELTKKRKMEKMLRT
jgi:hypothetical protein